MGEGHFGTELKCRHEPHDTTRHGLEGDTPVRLCTVERGLTSQE